MGWKNKTEEELIGQTVLAVHFNKEFSDQIIQLVCADGWTRELVTDGDCCSFSWIEHVSNVSEIVGEKILSVQEVSLASSIDEHHDCLQVYSFKLRTSKGALEIEFRNSSNGYYGGWLDYERKYAEPTVQKLEADV